MNITALPLEIVLTITHIIDPLDIIHLCQTCRVFYAICYDKIVWTSRVRQLRKQNTVYPSLPAHGGSTLSDLQHEATAPTRFVSLLRRQAKSEHNLRPKLNRFVISPTDDEVIRTIRLVPGGHLLVTASHTALRIWDVDSEEPHLIQSWDINVSDILAITRSRNEDLRIAVATRIDGKLHLRIFDFNYPTLSSKIHSLSLESWNEHHYFPVYTLSLDYFIFIIGSVLHAWNFSLKKYNKWSIPKDRYERMDSETAPQLVLFMSKTKCYGWEPRVPNHTIRDSDPPLQLVPDFALDVPPVTYGIDTIRCSLATWYGSSDYSFIFDIATKGVGDDNYTFSSYEIHPPDSAGNPGIVQYLSTEYLPSRSTPGFRMQLYVYRAAHNKLFKMWYNEFDMPPTCFTVAFRDDPRTPTEGFQDDPCVEVDLLLPQDGNVATSMMIDANLDPSSGRLCYLMTESTSVGVVDYLPSV